MLVLATLDGWTRGALSLPALVPPFGASVAIVFFAPESPAGRPWNVVVGQTASAFMGCLALWLLPEVPVSVQAAVAVAGAGLAMIATRSFHPPGGATALLSVIAEKKLGFAMLLCPMLIGSLALVGLRYAFDLAIARWATRAVSAERA
jgi:CBS domain-containing membrane protein